MKLDLTQRLEAVNIIKQKLNAESKNKYFGLLDVVVLHGNDQSKRSSQNISFCTHQDEKISDSTINKVGIRIEYQKE